jgi:hypothetical protein
VPKRNRRGGRLDWSLTLALLPPALSLLFSVVEPEMTGREHTGGVGALSSSRDEVDEKSSAIIANRAGRNRVAEKVDKWLSQKRRVCE